MIRRIRDAVAWRWRRAQRVRYLRRNFRNGNDLVRSYLDRTPCDTAVCLDGTVIRHPPGRIGLAGMLLEIWFDQVYTGRFYTPRTGDTIIDAGANIGLFSLLLARECSGARVLAFEPFAENFRLLTENLTAARAKSVEVFEAALSGGSGEAAMVDGGGRSQDHRLATRPAGESPGPTIRTVSLPEVLGMTGGGEIALFKCDIEGSERELFASAAPEHLRRVRRYAIEYHDNLVPGTLEFLKARLGPTHALDIRPAPEGGYGMLYASQTLMPGTTEQPQGGAEGKPTS